MRLFRHPRWQHLDYRVKVATTQENKPPTQGTRQWTFTTPRWRCGSILLPSLNAGVPEPTGGISILRLGCCLCPIQWGWQKNFIQISQIWETPGFNKTQTECLRTFHSQAWWCDKSDVAGCVCHHGSRQNKGHSLGTLHISIESHRSVVDGMCHTWCHHASCLKSHINTLRPEQNVQFYRQHFQTISR